MSDVVIRAEGIGKRYRIGERERYSALRDKLAQALLAPWKFFQHAPRETFWALRDVNFEVREGEVLGLIGRNGAGKTTLLKILSRITRPTTGWAEVHGHVGSLLEVGTGFHPELTGRENTFLSGAILGMKKREIERKFDEIVAFAEIEKFIDTPVKHYSSGMFVRLAFAVAAHLEPEILLVDEVLAVGDIAFQKKCLGKMGDVARSGRTVVFVSHNLGAVTRLCQAAIWLDEGKTKLEGRVEDVVAAYVSTGAVETGERRWDGADRVPGNDKMQLRAVRVIGPNNEAANRVDIRQSFWIEIEYCVLKKLTHVRTALRLQTSDGTIAFTSADSLDDAWDGVPRPPGVYTSRCEIPGNFLNEGPYWVTVSADIPFVEPLFYEEGVVSFFVEQTGGVSGRYPERWPGVICPALKWQIQQRDFSIAETRDNS
ncbi:MAG: ABC transporter ATP-binding protein [Candidatus Acidiferrales bacterium]|jgi:lipopolysaccharide transport system ATP-binding protein